ncbi:MAG: PAS domain S-box protein [Phaeospirillum sp.]|nr:PAS domain S-box protein [Phaeospirillum sp.]
MAGHGSPAGGGRSYSIRRVVTALVVALVAIVSAQAVRQCMAAWDGYVNALKVIETNDMVDRLLQSAQNLAFERGRTNVVLRGPDPISGDNRVFLDQRRNAAASNMDEALRRIPAGLEQQGGAVRSGYARLIGLRAEIDAAVSHPLAARDPTLADRWFSTTSGLLKDIAGLASAVALRRDRFTPEFRILSRVKGMAFELRDALGVESSRIAATMVAGNAMSRATLVEIMQLRGQGAASWSALRREVALTDSIALTAALETVGREFFGKFRPLEDQAIAALTGGQPLPLSIKAFTGASVPALDSIAALMSAATAETLVYAQANLEQTRMAMVYNLASGALAISLGVGTVLVTIGRLLTPLYRVQCRLAALAAGDAAFEPRRQERSDEIGQMQEAMVALHDSLIERRRVETELRATTTRLGLVLETAGEGIFGIDGDGRISFANQTVARVFGFSSVQALLGRKTAEAVGHRLADGSPCHDGMCFIRATMRDGRTRRVTDEFFQMADGIRTPVEYVVSPQMAGNSIVGAVVVFHDIVERRRAEREMQELLARQRAVLGNTPIGIAIVDQDRRIIEANEAFGRVFGRDADGLIGQPTTVLYADSEQYEEIGHRAYPMIEQGQVFESELLMKRGDGSDVWVRAVAHMVDEKAPELGVVWAAEDVTERKALELDIKRSNAELERFAYVASHDLRQPLRMVSSYLMLLERRLKERLDEDERQFIGFAVDGAKRMDRMIIDLLEYSRLGCHGQAGEVVSLAGILGQAVDNLGAAIAESGAEVVIPSGLPQVFGFESELVRLFQNLIGNAIKFRAPDRRPSVTLECVDMAREWIIAVSDNGIGIAPEDHQRLFVVFQRLVSQEQYEGNGIGLAVCRKICENNGGRIWVESEKGAGSTFLVALPKLV